MPYVSALELNPLQDERLGISYFLTGQTLGLTFHPGIQQMCHA